MVVWLFSCGVFAVVVCAVVFLWCCGGVFCGGVFVAVWLLVVFLWLCFCGGVVVFSVVVWWCFWCGVFGDCPKCR